MLKAFSFKIMKDCPGSSFPSATIKPTVLVHGGAGRVRDEKMQGNMCGVKRAAQRGYDELQRTGSVLGAVEESVKVLEHDSHFNAGLGSVLTCEGTVEMDAAIMHGAELEGGCVSLVRDITHPITLARRVMERTPHRFLAGAGAMRLAEAEGFEILATGALVTEAAEKSLAKFKAKNQKTNGDGACDLPGTVGAVAIDACGNVAAATSTGGITGKLPGRIGDSSLLGAGTYADNESGAVSATGHGETVMRFNVAARVLALVQHKNLSMQEAAEQVLREMTKRFSQKAGLIAIDHRGLLGIYFTTLHMPWSYRQGNELHSGVNPDEHQVEIINTSL